MQKSTNATCNKCHKFTQMYIKNIIVSNYKLDKINWNERLVPLAVTLEEGVCPLLIRKSKISVRQMRTPCKSGFLAFRIPCKIRIKVVVNFRV